MIALSQNHKIILSLFVLASLVINAHLGFSMGQTQSTSDVKLGDYILIKKKYSRML